MPQQAPLNSLGDLEAYLDIVGSALVAGKPENRFPSLLMMALIVSEFPPGDMQDAAENILCTYIAEVNPTPDELEEIRQKRRRV